MSSGNKITIIVALIGLLATLIQVLGPVVRDKYREESTPGTPPIIVYIPTPIPLYVPTSAGSSSVETDIRYALETAWFIRNELDRLPHLRNALRIAQDSRRTHETFQIQNQIAEAEANIRNKLVHYGTSLSQLAKNSSGTVNSVFQNYRDDLSRRGIPDHIRICDLVQQHFQAYLTYRTFDTSTWESDLERL